MVSFAEMLGSPTEAITAAAWQWACMLRSCIPGIVKSFDPAKQTVKVQVAIQEVMLQPPQGVTGDFTQNVPTHTQIDTLEDIPIVMMRVPGWSITLPIAEGTECLLLFADTCIDGWWMTGKLSVPMSRRRHDVSDAIALFGPWSQPKCLENYSTNSMQLRSDDGTVCIDLAPSKITITAPEVDLNTTGDVKVNAGGNATVQAEEITLQSNGTKIDGKDFLTHTHSGVQTGGANTGPVS